MKFGVCVTQSEAQSSSRSFSSYHWGWFDVVVNANHVYLVPKLNPEDFVPNPNQITLFALLLSSVSEC